MSPHASIGISKNFKTCIDKTLITLYWYWCNVGLIYQYTTYFGIGNIGKLDDIVEVVVDVVVIADSSGSS